MGSGGITQTRHMKKGEITTTLMKPQHSQPAQVINKSVQSLDVGSRQRIQILKEGPASCPQPQPTKYWVVTEEVSDSL